ncbi:unnamed protein product [Allacma fusca]|uniref:Uncharacterized protein n=1 Tax=Allacma fusca TaxID=39272 RepID=A0A8J2PR16_9HEXA|nr:unnamed protein product [Allacma fusca]
MIQYETILLAFVVTSTVMGFYTQPMRKDTQPSFSSALETFKKKAKPTLGTAPLDVDDTIDGELATLTQILHIVGGGASGLVAGLTGISTTNCATQIKERGDLATLTCAQFIDAVSNCESLMYVKDLLQKAKQNLKKDPSSKKPCFK